MTVTLNGWTSARLDDLAADVSEIKHQLTEMRSEELTDLKRQLHEAQVRPRIVVTAYLAPFIAGLIPTLLILFTHA